MPTNSSQPYDTIPLLWEGDAYSVDISRSLSNIRIIRILRVPGNNNSNAVVERYYDLPEETCTAIVQQIRRRYPKDLILP